MNKTVSTLLAAAVAALCLQANAADDKAAAAGTGVTKDQGKDLKTQSEADYKARKKIVEANEVLDKADCKTALDGAAKRACDKSAKAGAKGAKADAKMVHEIEEKAIKDAKK